MSVVTKKLHSRINLGNQELVEIGGDLLNELYIKKITLIKKELFKTIEGPKFNITREVYRIIYDWGNNLIKLDDLIPNPAQAKNNLKKLDSNKRLEKILERVYKELWWVVIGINFTRPADAIFIMNIPNLSEYKFEGKTNKATFNRKILNIWYYDTIFIKNAKDFLKNFNENSLHLVGVVWDCAAITGINVKTNAISLTHAWRQWVVNWVLESLVKEYELNWDIKDVIFYISPMAGKNYEWEKLDSKDLTAKLKKLIRDFKKIKHTVNNSSEDYITENLENLLKGLGYLKENLKNNLEEEIIKSIASLKNNIIRTKKLLLFVEKLKKEYNIDLEKDWIFVPYENNPNKWTLYLDRLIEEIWVRLWVPRENIRFAIDENNNRIYTTDLENWWPSYRIYSLWRKWLVSAEQTKKSENGIMYNRRILVISSFYGQ